MLTDVSQGFGRSVIDFDNCISFQSCVFTFGSAETCLLNIWFVPLKAGSQQVTQCIISYALSFQCSHSDRP